MIALICKTLFLDQKKKTAAKTGGYFFKQTG